MSVGQQPLSSFRYSAGVGYISLVSDLSREEYIRNCYRNNSVSIKMEDGSVSHQVLIPIEVLNFIEFPQNVERRGTPVIWVNEPVSGRPMIVSLIPSSESISDLEEGMFKITRRVGSTIVEICGSNKGFLNLTVQGDSTSQLNLIVNNKNNEGELNLKVQGDLKLEGTDYTSLKASRLVEISSQGLEFESTIRLENKNIKIDSEGVELGEGTEPLLLGQQTINFMEKLLDTIYRSTVTTQLGQMPLLNKEEFKSMKEELEELKSKVSFTE